jgi:hypothetical protein
MKALSSKFSERNAGVNENTNFQHRKWEKLLKALDNDENIFIIRPWQGA